MNSPRSTLPRRYFPRPVKLTFRCNSLFLRPQPTSIFPFATLQTSFFRVALRWSVDSGEQWAVGVWAVRRVNVDTLFNRVAVDAQRVIPQEETMRNMAEGPRGWRGGALDAPTVYLNCVVSGFGDGRLVVQSVISLPF
jgi:hypothetical protein